MDATAAAITDPARNPLFQRCWWLPSAIMLAPLPQLSDDIRLPGRALREQSWREPPHCWTAMA